MMQLGARTLDYKIHSLTKDSSESRRKNRQFEPGSDGASDEIAGVSVISSNSKPPLSPGKI